MTDLERAGEAAWEAFLDASPDAPLGYAWQNVARAALLALRSPSEAMIDAAHDGLCPFELDMPCRDRIRLEWQAAIDSILSPASQGATTETETR